MGTLDRYRKSGGFVQILSLIEGLPAAKQEKYLGLIEAESAVWAEAIRHKMLTVSRILGWPEQTVAEIVKSLPIKTLSVLLKGVKPEENEKIVKFFSHSEKRKIEDEQTAFSSIGDGEIAAANVKLIEAVRAMIKEGQIRLEKIDMELLLDEDIEEQLNSASEFYNKEGKSGDVDPNYRAPLKVVSKTSVGGPNIINVHSGETASQSKDVNTLQMKIMNLDKENKSLKQEVKHLREKLEQIKKMAA